MKKIFLLMAAMLLVSGQLFAADNVTRLEGAWKCDVVATMPLLPKEDQTQEIRGELERLIIFFDTKTSSMGMVIDGKKEPSGSFKILANKGNQLRIAAQDGEEFIIEFANDKYMFFYDPRDKANMSLYFNKVK